MKGGKEHNPGKRGVHEAPALEKPEAPPTTTEVMRRAEPSGEHGRSTRRQCRAAHKAPSGPHFRRRGGRQQPIARGLGCPRFFRTRDFWMEIRQQGHLDFGHRNRSWQLAAGERVARAGSRQGWVILTLMPLLLTTASNAVLPEKHFRPLAAHRRWQHECQQQQ